MKKLIIYCCLIFIVFASCKKDKFYKNYDVVVDTVNVTMDYAYFNDPYYLIDNSFLYLNATSPGAISYFWLPTNQTTPIVGFIPNHYLPYNYDLNSGLFGGYEVIITYSDTTIRYSIGVIADEAIVYYPNLFTPNHDGSNDKWTITCDWRTARFISLTIYDQQNRKDFKTESDDYDKRAWDGNYNGSPCDAGNYYFVFHYKTVDGGNKSKEGMFELIR